MADTPRGPRPTIPAGLARSVLAGWVLVAALLVAAAILPRSSGEDGWSRERLDIVAMPYADCDDGTCTIRPTLKLPDGAERRVQLTVRHPDELLPSSHFREGGTLEAWVSSDGERVRSLRPTEQGARRATIALVYGALFIAIGLCRAAWRARRAHDPRHAGHVTDHAAVWGAPLAVLVLGVALLVAHHGWRTPVHDPTLPPDDRAQLSDRAGDH